MKCFICQIEEHVLLDPSGKPICKTCMDEFFLCRLCGISLPEGHAFAIEDLRPLCQRCCISESRSREEYKHVTDTDAKSERISELRTINERNERMSFESELTTTLDEIRTLLIAKNKSYGNSALEPIRVFSEAEPHEQLLVRIDDKLSRIKNRTMSKEDTILDLIGYLVLLRMSTNRKNYHD